MNRLNHRSLSAVALVSTVLTLFAGCSSVKQMLDSDRIDYKNASTAPALSIPPDLDSTKIDTRYSAPPTTAGLGTTPNMSTTVAGTKTIGVPSTTDPYGMHVEQKDGEMWLVVNGRGPDALWEELRSFWTESGFVLTTDSPTTGVMQTDWAENRAKIPNDWFRSSIGKLFDAVYSSGTRDRFTTLVERGGDGSTRINITQTGMEEVLTGNEKTSSRWERRPRDTNLEKAFVARLIHRFGPSVDEANELVDHPVDLVTGVTEYDNAGGVPRLVVSESFDKVWPRVGLALDRSDYVVESRDAQHGLYTVHYSDSLQEVQDEGFFSKFLSSKKRTPPAAFKISVAPSGNTTQITVMGADGTPDASSSADALLKRLRAQLR